ncbi:2-hydroxyacid dehydrogenase [Pseudoflavonifractor phocaeensis]|uniref:2-hydroxyacid dehydrogenase n=1 Tax=Pseudoflavonifractor phocaeensis TaxID=1870988 RepID=UPI00195AA7C8|nr:2-hydroxyacid dehydrogenase [Pseudoflavonifractor phocaeensis]MBM6870392.1 hydroxyacid dehydrogenase [Pseudoflavonifractor phocaeensis]
MKLALLEPLGIPQDRLVEMVAQAVDGRMDVVAYDTRVEDVPTLIQRSQDADAVVLSNFPYRKEVMAHCPNLKYIDVAFTGVDHVDIDYCREKGIAVSNCAGYSTVAVADLVFGMVLSLARNLSACDAAVRQGGTKAGLVGFELEGKKFGVIGAGAIGSRVAAIAAAFGCQVYAYSRTPKDLPGVTFTDLDTLLSTCDIVSLHVPATPQTHHLINAEKLALMKPTALLINTARGPVVDSQALADALNGGRLAGAGIDVFEMEPPVPGDHPLLTAKNVLATPHVAFATAQSMEKRAVLVCENLRAWLDGKQINKIC